MMLGFQAAAARAGGRHTEGCPTTGTAQPCCLHQRVLWDFLSAQPCWLHADMALLPPLLLPDTQASLCPGPPGAATLGLRSGTLCCISTT